MSQKNSKSQDEISQLLDSFQEDDTLEEKMDAFCQEKERKSRLDRAKKNKDNFRRQYSEEVDLTQIMNPIEDEDVRLGANDLDDSSQTRTMMWNPDEIEEETQDTNKTVVINDDEIQSLLDEDQGPKLKREVHRGKASSGPDKKMIALVVAGIIGVLLVCGIIFGVVKMIGDGISDDKITEQEQQKNYEEILAWANDYDTLSDDEKANITDYESMFNKLSDEQQEKIDSVLKAKTGKTFDALLAQAKSDAKNKKNSKNNNTEIAQQKAELRDQINDLKSQLRSAQTELDTANSTLSSKQSALETAQSEYDSASSKVTQLQADINRYSSDADMYKKQYESYYTDYLNLAYDDPQRDTVWTQVQTAKSNMDSSNASLTQAQSDLSAAQSSQSSYKSTLDNAQNEYNSAKDAVDSAQAKVDSLNAQISSLQDELDSLDD